ncbi:TetR family transcriptional regulator [Streptomyces sp. SID4948]|nr:TetR family transcriptional regulator [Streptomyces sp. SID4948]
MNGPSGDRGGPRRAAAEDERRYDPERSRRQLLAAALDEFAAKGFSGARVQDIADRAGVNKQLINYYFGGKEGLYEGLREEWQQRRGGFADPDLPLDELAVRYLRDTLDDPRRMRLLTWRALSGETGGPAEEDAGGDGPLSRTERRRELGEIAAELDPGVVLVAVMAAVAAPVTMPQQIREFTGLDPQSPEFAELYTEQLRRIVRRLGTLPADASVDEAADVATVRPPEPGGAAG